MSLVYRALWVDPTSSERDDRVARARACLSRWVTDDPAAVSLDDGEHGLNLEGQAPRARTVRVRSVVTDEVRGFEAVVLDVADDGKGASTTWTTTLRVAATDAGVHTWIDNAVETDDATLGVKVGRPRVVDYLLALPGKKELGGSAVLASALAVSAGEVPVIVDVLRDTARTLPYIVFSQPPGSGDSVWQRKAGRPRPGLPASPSR